MVLRFEEDHIVVSHLKGQQNFDRQVDFTKPVTSAKAVLRGFRLSFDQAGTPTKLIEISVHTPPPSGSNIVKFKVVTQFQDTTGLDEYSGFIDIVVIGDTAQAAVSSPPGSPPGSPPA
jgi:hypothetical protein